MSLFDFGWSSRWESSFAHLSPPSGWQPARVLRQDRGYFSVVTEDGIHAALPSGRFQHQAREAEDHPAVGDWVAVERPVASDAGRLHAVLPRQNRFVRKEAGDRHGVQVVAANVDRVLLVTGLDGNFRRRRIERYLAVAAESGVEPVIVLTKGDLCPEPARVCAEVEAVAGGVPVVTVSALRDEGLEDLRMFLRPGQTVALLGSSGVGKSTLLNCLLGAERQKVQASRTADSRGRHTTTARELFVLPDGALMIDTPGMRELGLTGAEGGTSAGFEVLEELAAACRFRDCSHGEEPGCAVQAALAGGTLEAALFEHWQRLRREQAFAARQRDQHLQRAESARWKRISRMSRQQTAFQRRNGKA